VYDTGSYTKRLFDDSALLKSKLLEECEELLAADNKKEVAFETADVIYFAFAACARHGVHLAEVQRSLARKHLRVRRRLVTLSVPLPEHSGVLSRSPAR
jgi:phosphoribosyl-ATP pyrophosphohydrolase/phosphoribosyl-AMP cyclohydrolase/histidinol dehydrogenase